MVVQHAIALLAIPAFLPAFAVVGAIIWIARKDCLDEQRELDEGRGSAHDIEDGADPADRGQATGGRLSDLD